METAEEIEARIKAQAAVQKSVEDAEFRIVLSTYQGRKFAWDLMEQCGVYQLSFTGKAEETAFREGRRSVGLWFLDKVFTADPNCYNIVRQEAEDRRKKQETKETNG